MRSLAIFVAAGFVVMSGGLSAQTRGTLTVTENRTLSEDHHGIVIIARDRVNLVCNGRTILGNGTGVGVELTGRAGVLVQDCNIMNFLKGVSLIASSANVLRGNSITQNVEEGVELERSDNNLFLNNESSQNGRDGFDLDDSNGNVFIENDVIENTFNGFELDRSSNNSFVFNIADNNGRNSRRSGFSLDDANSNFFGSNQANSNGRNGFRIDGSGDGIFQANVGSGNAELDCITLGGFAVRNVYLDNNFVTQQNCVFFRQGD